MCLILWIFIIKPSAQSEFLPLLSPLWEQFRRLFWTMERLESGGGGLSSHCVKFHALVVLGTAPLGAASLSLNPSHERTILCYYGLVQRCPSDSTGSYLHASRFTTNQAHQDALKLLTLYMATRP